MNAESLEGDWDYIIVHDPQPVGMKQGAQERGKHWIWRCHIDLSEPNPDPIEKLLPQIAGYDMSVWHMEQYVPDGPQGPRGDQHRPSGDRPALAEEHGLLAPRTPPSSASSSASTSTAR